MPDSVLDRVRTTTAEVAIRARYVQTGLARIPAYAVSLSVEDAPAPTLDLTHHFVGAPGETIAFILTLDAINFGSGYFPHLRKRPGLSGYFTVATALTERFRSHGPYTAAELEQLTTADCVALFGQDQTDEAVGELMSLFSQALNDLGRHLSENFDGSFVRLVEAADHSAERLIDLLRGMPFYRDVARYDNLEVAFYKRAQLTAADLSLALDGQGLGAFHDLDRLTIFADNLVPHVLRVDGILRYAPALEARIEAERLIEAGSFEEIEIRASAVYAVELMVEALRRVGRGATAARLDYLLWNRGQQPAYKASPRHRARSVFY